MIQLLYSNILYLRLILKSYYYDPSHYFVKLMGDIVNYSIESSTTL